MYLEMEAHDHRSQCLMFGRLLVVWILMDEIILSMKYSPKVV